MKNNEGNIPYIHFVFGPGCDGESTPKQLKDAMMGKENNFLGSFELSKKMIECMRNRSKSLGDTRTPNIMYSAYMNKGNVDDMIMIPRGRKPRVSIPRKWLFSAWAFSRNLI